MATVEDGKGWRVCVWVGGRAGAGGFAHRFVANSSDTSRVRRHH